MLRGVGNLLSTLEQEALNSFPAPPMFDYIAKSHGDKKAWKNSKRRSVGLMYTLTLMYIWLLHKGGKKLKFMLETSFKPVQR